MDPLIAESVVWPEMERYTRLQDLAETAAVYGTYITTGGGPDYSIGLFQMKPSFIENLEKQYDGQITLIETFTYTPVNITIQ